MTTFALIALLVLVVAVLVLVVLMRRDLAMHRARTGRALAQAARASIEDRRLLCGRIDGVGELLDATIDMLSEDTSLVGRTVVLERPGHEVPNVQGVVIAGHADHWSLDQAQAVTSDGLIPLEHPVIHVPKDKVLSVSEVRG